MLRLFNEFYPCKMKCTFSPGYFRLLRVEVNLDQTEMPFRGSEKMVNVANFVKSFLTIDLTLFPSKRVLFVRESMCHKGPRD